MNTYRVWMRDGCASLQNAESEENAREQAVQYATKTTTGLAMTAADRRKAVTVESCDLLNRALR